MSPVVDPVGAGPPVVTTAPPAPGTSVGRSSVLLSAASGAVGLVSYGCGLAMAHLLPTGAYGGFAAAQMLLTIVGTVAASLVPLPLADRVRATRPGSAPRRAAVSFAVQVSLALGVASAAVTGSVALGFAPPSVAAAVAVSALAIAAVAPAWGWLQGEAQFGRYAVATVAEVTLRLVVSVVVVLAGARAWGAIMGFAAGALLIVGCGVGWLRRDLTWRSGALRDRVRWADTGAIAATQLVLSALVAADVLVVAFSGAVSPDAAGFQALATLAKGPVYLAGGAVVVLFPLLRAGGADAGPALDRALRTFLRIALLAAVLLATVPIEVAALVLPAAYLPALSAAPWLAVAGLGYGVVTVGVTVLLALRRGARSRLGLATSVVLIGAGLGIGHSLGGVPGLAAGAAVGAAGAAAVVGRLLGPLLTAGVVRAAARTSGVAAVGLGLLELTRHAALVWAAVATVAGASTVWGLRGERSASSVDRTGQLRILHLGFEDPAMPGSGGGSLRTHETARRIAADHDVTVLAQRYPGCAARVQDGVRYEHVGIGAGRTRLTRVLGYMLRLPGAVRGREADLVVEDFFAPVSTIGAPLWSGKPTVGVVQWLNAREKAAQYKMPVHLVERFGVRRHRRLVAVSDGLRGRLLALNPALHVEVIGNGVAQEAFAPEPALGAGVVYVGRLEIAQKGLDLLLDAWRLAHPRIRGELVIAGTGPDEPRLRARVAALGLADRVRFAGWVDGAAKFALMASARVVAVPSRYETFGIVAIEAAATGTPVVAFDIDCLREVVPDVCGRRVPPFDVPAYAAALVATHDDLRWIEDGAAQRRTFARRHDWDSVAARQQRVYVEAARPP